MSEIDEQLSLDDVKELAEGLSSSSRRLRQASARKLSGLAKTDPSAVIPYVSELADALNRPEAQTRWECLDALTALVPLDPHKFLNALDDVDTALFDEESGFVRLGAMRYLCVLGAQGEDLSERVWPLIDEGIQCLHGDPEYSDVLDAVVDFSSGALSDGVRERLRARMAFDAENAKGSVGRRSLVIVQNTKKG